MQHFAYGSAVRTPLSLEAAIERISAAFAAEGWSVLFDLDLAAALNAEPGEPFRPYRVLGAFNPKLALEALAFEDDLGLLLPWHIAVSSDDEGTHVAVVNVHEAQRVTNNGMLTEIGERTDAQLARVLASLPSR